VSGVEAGVLRTLVVIAAVCRIAAAHPPPPPPELAEDPGDWRDEPARIEWSTWFRLGAGVEHARAAVAARTTSPAPDPDTPRWETGLGIDASLTLTAHTRFGAWAELRGTQGFAGAELVVSGAPRSLDMFLYRGEGVLALRAGVGPEHQTTAALAYGYRCPWKLWGPYSRATRYEIGARVVGSVTRGPDAWSATIGLEVEPVGAIRYLLGIRSWY
jgi:hypothetical protein